VELARDGAKWAAILGALQSYVVDSNDKKGELDQYLSNKLNRTPRPGGDQQQDDEIVDETPASKRNRSSNMSRIKPEELSKHASHTSSENIDMNAYIKRSLGKWLDDNSRVMRDLENLLERRAEQFTLLRLAVLQLNVGKKRLSEEDYQCLFLCFVRDILVQLQKLRPQEEVSVEDVRQKAYELSLGENDKVCGRTDIGRLIDGSLRNGHYELKQPDKLTVGITTQEVRQLIAETEALGRRTSRRSRSVDVGVLTDGYLVLFDMRLQGPPGGKGVHVHDDKYVTQASAAMLRIVRVLIGAVADDPLVDVFPCANGTAGSATDDEFPRQPERNDEESPRRRDDSDDLDHTPGPNETDNSQGGGGRCAASFSWNDWDAVPYEIEHRVQLDIGAGWFDRTRLTAPNLEMLGKSRVDEHES